MSDLGQLIAPVYGDLTLGGAELEEIKNLRIFRVTLDFKLMFETHLREVVSKAARSPGLCGEQESDLIVHVCSRAVSMHMFCQAWSIVPPCGCRRRSLIWVCWIELFAVRKGCVRDFVVCGTEKSSVPQTKQTQVPCVCSIKFITEWTTL